MNEVIVLLTHVWNNSIDKLFKELNSCKTTIILWDKYSKNIPPKYKNIVCFDKINHNLNVSHHISEKHLFFNDFLPLFLIINILQQYDRIWLIESDVRFNGSWKYFFSIFDKSKENLLLSRYKSFEQDRFWYWWPMNNSDTYNLRTPFSLNNININHWGHGLFCISRIDINLLKLIFNKMPDYSDYFEALVPTIARQYGFSIRDFGEILASDFDWLPVDKMTEYNKLYHAIKT